MEVVVLNNNYELEKDLCNINYYLLDYNIIHLPRKIYNEKLGIFETSEYIYLSNDEDIEMEKEINEIKEKVPIKERKLFLK